MKNKKVRIIFIILILAVMTTIFAFYKSVKDVFVSKVETEFMKQPLQKQEMLTLGDIEGLPPAVKKYIICTGAVGKPKVQNMRLEFDAEMLSKPNAKPMISTVVQYSFLGSYSRFFFLKTSMFLVPVRVLHAYTDFSATMWVRVASLFNLVNLSGPNLSFAETVTILNDMCVFAPGALIDKRLSWKEIDSLRTEVAFRNGPHTVKAVMFFNEKGELVDFESGDRPPAEYYGTGKTIIWSTPLKDYKEIAGYRLTTEGEAVYHNPDGNFRYGVFKVRKIDFNVKEFKEQ